MIYVREYDDNDTYNKNDYCIYNNKLYKANQNISSAEDFDSSHWDETSTMNEISGFANFFQNTEKIYDNQSIAAGDSMSFDIDFNHLYLVIITSDYVTACSVDLVMFQHWGPTMGIVSRLLGSSGAGYNSVTAPSRYKIAITIPSGVDQTKVTVYRLS